MKFFKTEQPISWEDETAAVRLSAIAARTKTGHSPSADEASAEQAKAETQPEVPDTLK
jgi:hypothetical protein